jgi:hypothetical protein
MRNPDTWRLFDERDTVRDDRRVLPSQDSHCAVFFGDPRRQLSAFAKVNAVFEHFDGCNLGFAHRGSMPCCAALTIRIFGMSDPFSEAAQHRQGEACRIQFAGVTDVVPRVATNHSAHDFAFGAHLPLHLFFFDR